MNFIGKIKEMPIQAKASLAYTIANLISKGISIITVPIFTRILTTAEVGIGTTYSAWYSIIYSVVTLSLTSGSLNIAMVHYQNNRDRYESSILSICTLTGSIFLIFSLVFGNAFSEISSLGQNLIILISISLIINPALELWYARQRYEYKYKSSVAVSISVTILSAAIGVVMVLTLRDYTGINLGEVKTVSQGIVLLIASSMCYFYVMIKGKCFFDKDMWKNALAWSLPLIVHSLSKSVLDLSDRVMISSMCGQSEAGIYGTVYSLAMLSLIVWNAINTSLIPTTFEKLEKCDYISLRKIVNSIVAIFGITALCVTLLAPEILLLFTTDEYLKAVQLVPALSAGIFFTAIYNIYGNFLLYKKKTGYIMIGTLVAAITNIILNLIGISLFGYMAAAYTTWISFVLLAGIQARVCERSYSFRVLDDKSLFLAATCISLLCVACNLIYNLRVLRFIIVATLVIIVGIKRKKIFALISKI